MESDPEAHSVSFAAMYNDGDLDRSRGTEGDYVGRGFTSLRSSSQLDFDQAILKGELNTFLTNFISTKANIKQYLCSVADRIRYGQFRINDKMSNDILSFITDDAMYMDQVSGLGEFYDVFKTFYSNRCSIVCLSLIHI